jgi:DinB superfamily
MPTMEEYAKQPREQRMQRLTRTADELAAAIKGQGDAVLSRRPDAKNWAAKEIVCHLRDTEEAFGGRFEQILAMDVDPKLGGPSADRWAEERQYLRNDATEALAAFRKRRGETLEIFGKLTPAQWDKGGIHPVRGRITLDAFLTLMAWHDDNHLDQLGRALDGRA